MGSKNERFSVDVKEAGLLADSVISTITKKTHNPAETLMVLKMAIAIFEAYLEDQGVNFDTKELDIYLSEFKDGLVRFQKGLSDKHS